MSLYAAFNTLQTELERLLQQRQSIALCIDSINHHRYAELEQLDANILSHEQALKLLISKHLTQQNYTIKQTG